MTQLQYQTPNPPMVNLRSIASRQRAVIYCILANIALIVALFAAPPAVKVVVVLAFFAVGITGSVFAFMLAIEVFGTGVGIVMGILTLIPYLGLIFLLIINARGTKILKQHGIEVGLLGAKTMPG